MSPFDGTNTPQTPLHGPPAVYGGGGGTAANPKHTPPKKASKSKGKKARRGKSQAGQYDWFKDPLTQQLARKETHAASYQKYHNQFSDLQNELAVSKTMQKRTEQWYDDYKREVNRATKRSRGIYADAAGQIRSFTNQGSQQAQQMQAALDAQAQQDAALRGTTVDPSIAATGAQATGARHLTAESTLGNLVTHGAANSAYLSNQARNVAAQKLLAHQEEAGRARKLRKERRDLHAEQGAFRITYRDQLRGTERNWWLAKKTLSVNEKKAAIAAALAQASQAETHRHNRALERDKHKDNMREDKKFQLDVKKFGADEAERRWKQAHRGSGKGGPSTTDRNAGRKIVGTLSQMISRAKSIYSHTGSAHQIYAYGRKVGWDNDLLNAAADVAILGHLSSTNRKRIQNRLKGTGVNIPGGW